MSNRLKIISWNIAGGHPLKVAGVFDEGPEDVGYFIEQLRAEAPDVVCLQENHTNSQRSVAREIASGLDMHSVYEVAASPSHSDSNYQLGNAIISRQPLKYVAHLTLPYPRHEMKFKDGRASTRHDKVMLVYKYDELLICTTHFLPMHIFEGGYETEAGRAFTHEVDTFLTDQLSKPLVLSGDFNHDNPKQILPNLYESLALREVLPDERTNPENKWGTRTLDHIITSDEVHVVEARVVETRTDHYMCVAIIEF